MRFVYYYPRAIVGDGGPTVSLWAWAGALAERGHRVEVLHSGGGTSTPLVRADVPAKEVSHRGRRRTLHPIDLEEHLEENDLLLLRSGYVLANLSASRQARRMNVPYIVIPLGAYDPSSRARRRVLKGLWNPVERQMLTSAAAVHVYFSSEVEGVLQLAPGARCIVAATGAKVPGIGWSGGGGYIAWVGRYDIEHKGIDLLLAGLARLSPRNRPRVIMHGRDSRNTRSQVGEMAVALGVGRDVEVLGPISGEAKRDFLLKAEGYVHPSRWESYGLALVENLALGVPTVVSSGCHISADLRRARASIVVPPDPGSISEGLVDLRNRQEELNRNARNFVAQQLNWDRIIDSYISQVNDLLDRRTNGVA